MIKMNFSIRSNYKGRAPLLEYLPNMPPRPKLQVGVQTPAIINSMPLEYIEKNRFSMYLPTSNCTSCGGAI